MLEEILIREAKRREEVFKNLSSYLNRLKETLRSMDPKGRLFLFGSSARGDNALISDIDILIVTSLNSSLVIATLWQEERRKNLAKAVLINEKLRRKSKGEARAEEIIRKYREEQYADSS